MSCISVTVSRIATNLKANVCYNRAHVMVKDIGNKIYASVSVICSLSEFAARLNVSPQEIQWITDYKGVYYEVESNVEWVVYVDGADTEPEILSMIGNATMMCNDTLISNGVDEVMTTLSNSDRIKNVPLLIN